MASKILKGSVILFFIGLIIFFINIYMLFHNNYLNLNKEVSVSGLNYEYNYELAKGQIKSKYFLKEPEVSDMGRSFQFERLIMDFSNKFIHDLFDFNYDSDIFMKKYFIRPNLKTFNVYDYYSLSDIYYKSYFSELKDLKIILNSNYITYEEISDIKLLYLDSNNYYVIVYLKNVSNYKDMILQFKVCAEFASGAFKVSKVMFYSQNEIDSSKSVNRFLDKDTIVNPISDEKILEIKEKFKHSVVRIEIYEDNIKIDEVTGFFVKSGVLLTTFDIFDKGMYEKYDYKIYSMVGDEYTYGGLINFSSYYNVATIKLTESVGVPVGDEILFFLDGIYMDETAVMVSSVSGKSKLGFVSETIERDSGYYIANMVLDKIDRGSPIINSKGKVIGIVTRVYPGSGVQLAVDTFTLSNIFYNNSLNNFSNIDIIDFNKKGIVIR